MFAGLKVAELFKSFWKPCSSGKATCRCVGRRRPIALEPLEDRRLLSYAPVAVDDLYCADEGATLTVAAIEGVLANDMDGDGDSLTAFLDSGPSNGSVTLKADGSFDYTPDAGFRGFDSFTYFVNDGTVDSFASAQVSLRVEPPQLLADINPWSWDYPYDFVQVGENVVFVACDVAHGDELWVTDGTPEGTMVLMDIQPGSSTSETSVLTVWGDAVYFRADDGENGSELWKTDGTPAGTTMVADIRSGSDSSWPYDLVAFGDALYFSADDGTTGRELWKTDGTAAGTTQVVDIRSGSSGSSLNYLTPFNGQLYFTASDGVYGNELWSTDGTATGTSMVVDLRSGSGSSYPVELTVAGNILYFRANDGTSGEELWKTDGLGSTSLVKDIRSGSLGSSPTWLTAAGETLFFRAFDGVNGSELWTSDGTEAGTAMVEDIWSGSDGSNPNTLTAADDMLYFAADDGVAGEELWVSDGTAAGTFMVLDIEPGSGSSFVYDLTVAGSTVYFSAYDDTHGFELWQTDGTASGTTVVSDIAPGSVSSWPINLEMVDGTLYFSATDAVDGDGLWISDGTAAGTEMLRQVGGQTQDSEPQEFVTIGDTTYFMAYSPDYGEELWKTDKITGATSLVCDILDGWEGSYPEELTAVGDTLYFNAYDYEHGTDLWKSDGTEAGTTIVVDLYPGSDDSYVEQLTAVGDTLYFTACNSDEDPELWKTDGTEAGTVMVKDIVPGIYGSWPWYLTAVGDSLFFIADDEVNGDELWLSDGTEAGTTLVKDIWSGIDSSDPSDLTAVGDSLFFVADDGASGYELWKSDGTEAGTVLVKDIFAGSEGSWPWALTAVGDMLYFVADDGASGYELWKSDGTEAGTVLVKDIWPGIYGSEPEWLTAAGGRIYFIADDDSTGYELWTSDGTEAGTVLVKDIYAGPSSSWPWDLTAVGESVFFAADDGVNDYELWVSDGTSAGTMLYADLYPGDWYSDPTSLYYDGEVLYFSAEDPIAGWEPWSAVLNDEPTDIALSNDSVAENEPIATVVGTFSATDTDAADTHSYSLVSGDGDAGNAFFSIDGNQLKTAAVFDYESLGSYSIRVEVLDSGGGVYQESLVVTVTDVGEYDFGDAPDPFYPTFLVSDGARHLAVGPTLGSLRDIDSDGQQDGPALGDDTDGSDDEDGLLAVSLPGAGYLDASVEVAVSTETTAYLNAWIDFNGNGTWEDAERIGTVDMPATSGSNTITFDIPADAVPGETVLRLRVTSLPDSGGGLPSGPADDGEVEDHLVTLEDDAYLYGGEATNDIILVSPGIAGTSSYQVSINGIVTTYDPAVYGAIHVDGFSGSDQVTINGTDEDETAVLQPGSVVFTSESFQIYIINVDTINVYAGSGNDLVTMTGSTLSNRLYRHDGYALFADSARSFRFYVEGFDTMSAVAPSGGRNYAYLYGTSGQDSVDGNPDRVILLQQVGTAEEVSTTVTGFQYVYGYGRLGTDDEAVLTGSSTLSNRFYSYADYSVFSDARRSFYFYMREFEAVTAESPGGPNSFAYLHDSAGVDTLLASPDSASLDRADSWCDTQADGFTRVYAYSTRGGDDTAELTGNAAGGNRYRGYPAYSTFSDVARTFYHYVYGYHSVTAIGSEDAALADRAYLYDSPGDDILSAVVYENGKYQGAALTDTAASYVNQIVYFDLVYARSSDSGTTDVIDIDAETELAYDLIRLGTW